MTLDGLNTVPPASYDLVYQREVLASVSFGVSLSYRGMMRIPPPREELTGPMGRCAW